MSPDQKQMVEDNLGIIRKVTLRFVFHHWAIDDSWQYAVACQAVCEAMDANKWNPKRAKFSTFVYYVAYYSIVHEWNKRERAITLIPFSRLKEADCDKYLEIPANDERKTLDIPYEEVFKNGFTGKLKRDVEMFRRNLEGETITALVEEAGITRPTFYSRMESVKTALAKHVVLIK